MKKSNEIGFIERIVLKFLTRRQEKALISGDVDEYLKLCKSHFRWYFDLDLPSTLLNHSNKPEIQALLHRHACMVISLIFPNSSNKKELYRTIQKTFKDNVLLGVPLKDLE